MVHFPLLHVLLWIVALSSYATSSDDHDEHVMGANGTPAYEAGLSLLYREYAEGAKNISKEEGGAFTTKSLSNAQLRTRAVFWQSFIGASVSAIIAVAVVAHIYKAQQCEMPVLKFKGCTWLPCEIESYDILPACLKCITTSRDGPGFASSTEPVDGANEEALLLGSAEAAAEREVMRESLDNADPAEQKEKMRQRWVQMMAEQAANQKKLLYIRKVVLCVLYFVYVVVCTAVPYWNAWHTSCYGGFFWEDHLSFEITFLLTKLVELGLYVFDPTVDGELPLWQFILFFVPSFLGYSDGYQDSTSVMIAHACAVDNSADVNHNLANTLSTTMAWSFWIGVVLFQWVCLGVAAIYYEPSVCVLAKLLHMDALAMCFSIDQQYLWMLRAVNAVRTFGEDIPQAFQQTVFVVYVKQNLFMIVSILFSVFCSFKSFYEALKRVSDAIGLEAKMLRFNAQIEEREANTTMDETVAVAEIRVRAGDLIDQICFVYTDGTQQSEGGDGGRAHPPFVLSRGEYITKIIQRVGDGMDMVQFFTSMGRQTSQYGNPDGGSLRPEIVASPGQQIFAVHRKSGYLKGIESITQKPAPNQATGH